MTTPLNLLVILGPTASGKTRLGVEAARRLGGEIISADSRQVYRGLDLGSGKDLAEYAGTPYHLIDVADPGFEFSLFAFARQFTTAFTAIQARGNLPLLVGGTGLYLDAVLRGYRLVEVPPDPALRQELAPLSLPELGARLQALRPDLHNSTDLTDRARLVRAIEIALGERAPTSRPIELPSLQPRIYGLRWSRQVLRRRITARLKERLDQGLLTEVAALHAAGVPWETLDYYGLEYRLVARHLQGMLTANELFQQLNSAIHQFAKRQETWFRRMERQGLEIRWLEGDGHPLSELLTDWTARA